jgi:flavin reductase (DIM6/NTAB) family NADH-FMN oxidoreductase RutF
MYYETAENRHGLKYDPFKALVAPRPIGWISSVDKAGRVNLAPYSFFNAVATKPPVVMFSSEGRKDSQRNIEQTGEFVCNLATWDLRDQMNVSSGTVEAEVDEMDLAGLDKAPSRLVRPPRVAASPAALECSYIRTVELPDGNGGKHHYSVIFGLVKAVHIADDVIVDGQVDVTRFRPIARLGYHDYAVVNEVFSLTRPDGMRD